MNNKFRIRSVSVKNHLSLSLALGLGFIGTMALMPELALAAGLDIDAGVKAATDPLVKGIENHWGKAVLICSAASGLFLGEGDMRQRTMRAGVGGVISGAFILGLLQMFK